MIKHLFKLMWHKRSKHFLLMSEIFIAFLVLFAVFSLLFYYYRNYRVPVGLEYENVWVVNFYYGVQPTGDTLTQQNELIKQTLRSFPEVEHFSFTSGNIPFSMNHSNTDVFYNNRRTTSNVYTVEPSYFDVLGMRATEGRLLEPSDRNAAQTSLVINEALKKELFENESPSGKNVAIGDEQQRIVGVVNSFKDKGNFQPAAPGMFRIISDVDLPYTMSTLLIRVRDGGNASLEENLWKKLSSLSADTTVEIERLTDKRVSVNKLTWVPMLILSIVCGFLIFNVALGLFGVLWYNINLRKEEIGLRRALGASGRQVTRQFVGEALVIATFGMALGTLLAIQFPLLNVFNVEAVVYAGGLLLATLFLFVVVWICAFYPGLQAALVDPAVALHDD